MSRPPLKTREDVIHLFLNELGISPFAQAKGPNNSELLFYGFGGTNFIVQVFHAAGWEVYGASPSNRVDESLDWIRQLAKVLA